MNMYVGFAKLNIIVLLLLSIFSLMLNVIAYLKLAKVFSRIKNKYERSTSNETEELLPSSPQKTDRLTAIKNANQEFRITSQKANKKDRAFTSEKEFKRQMTMIKQSDKVKENEVKL